MKFERVERKRRRLVKGKSKCFLIEDNWNDYNYYTTFDLVYFDDTETRFSIGVVKIMHSGMDASIREGSVAGHSSSVEIPDHFEQLSDEHCSLGQGQDFYEAVCELPPQVRDEILAGLRDCVEDQERFKRFAGEKAMQNSLMRSVSKKNMTKLFPSILAGKAELTGFDFGFHLADNDEALIEFKVVPNSFPPTNVHVLIGRNGVGKTRILGGIADAVAKKKSVETDGLLGEVSFYSDEEVSDGWFVTGNEDSEEFSNLVVVTFSNLDRFDPIPGKDVKRGFGYHYVGFKRHGEDEHDDVSFDDCDEAQPEIQLKSIEDLVPEFSDSLSKCLRGNRLKRWSRAMEILSSDPVFKDIGFDYGDAQPDTEFHQSLVRDFELLSSGHKIVLLTTTKLVECVNEQSLVLLDEPETHLHPPLLGSFIRALSELLINRNGVAIVATHSPVVLQEVPKTCVTLINRSGNVIETERPLIETFAENVGVLTREVFNLELLKSGYHQILADAAAENNVEEVLKLFENQIGGEGRAIIRALCYSKEK